MQVQKHLEQSSTPNAYFFTKRMAEVLISSYHSAKFPVAIVRPSLVGCTARAPHPGYFGNNAGPTAVGLAFAVGIATYTSHHVRPSRLALHSRTALFEASWKHQKLSATCQLVKRSLMTWFCLQPGSVFDVVPGDMCSSIILASCAASSKV